MNRKLIANYVDHTLLKPNTGASEINQLCKEAHTFGFYSVCVNPWLVKEATNNLKNSPVKICSVAGFQEIQNTDSHIVFKYSNADEAKKSHKAKELIKYINKHDSFKKGEYVYKIKVKTGDHLFVNRVTYNFRQPRRGDITVFTIKREDTTHRKSDPNVPEKDTFYIKRLVGLGGEEIKIGPDRHVRINGRRLNSADRGFEFIYSHPKTLIVKKRNPPKWKPIYDPINSMYSGHEDEGRTFTIKTNHYLFFGDNTANSADSRSWGTLPKSNVTGHSSFVYWPPLSPRFGWSHR